MLANSKTDRHIKEFGCKHPGLEASDLLSSLSTTNSDTERPFNVGVLS